MAAIGGIHFSAAAAASDSGNYGGISRFSFTTHSSSMVADKVGWARCWSALAGSVTSQCAETVEL